MRKWTLKEKKKLVVLLICTVLGGVLGFVDTLIPPLFAEIPFLVVQLGMLPALFVLLAYGPAEAILVWGAHSVVYGLVLDDGYAIIFQFAAAAAAFAAVWAVMRTQRFGAIASGGVNGVVYAFVYTCLLCIVPKMAAPFVWLAHSFAFYFVCHGVLGALAYLGLRFIPERLLFDDIRE